MLCLSARLGTSHQTGYISLANLQSVIAEIGEEASEAELREMIEEADVDKDGLINREEFLKIMEKKKSR